MGRQPCCDKIGLKRGPWTIEEDHKLMHFILNNGNIHCWRMVPKLAGLSRCGKSCRLRWINYLRPDVKRGAFSECDDDQIIQLHARLGNRWSKIAAHFSGRTDNEIKNHWNTRIKKRMKQLGLDPVSHKPIEQNEKHDRNIEHPLQANKEQEKDLLEAKESWNNTDQLEVFPVAHKKQVEFKLSSSEHDTMDLLHGYEIMWGSFNCEPLMVNPKLDLSNQTSPSFSLEDSLNPSSIVQSSSSSIQEESQQWVQQVDSTLSWDGFNHLDELLLDEFFSFENHPLKL